MDLASDDFEAPATSKRQRINIKEENKENAEAESDEENNASEEEDDGSEGCPICFEAWATSGFHRLVSLKCGHLFGKRCIERWLANPTSNTAARSKCPQCNAPAKRSDIRVLYAKKLIAMDTCEKDDLVRQVQEERVLKRMALEAEARANVLLQSAQAELAQTKSDLEKLKRRLLSFDGAEAGSPSVGIEFYKGFQIASQADACRCLDYDSYYSTFLISKAHYSGKGYGLSKVSLLSSCVENIHSIHSAPVRAVSHSPFKDGLVLTTGNDSLLALTSISSNTLLHSYKLECPGWSCAFNPVDSNQILAGLANGTVAVYDLRNTTTVFRKLEPELPRKLPIHSLAVRTDILIGSSMDGPFCMSLLNGSTIWKYTPIDNKGSCTSASFDPVSGCLLTSYRYSGEPSQHCLFDMSTQELVSSFSAASVQTVMSRSTLFSTSPSEVLAAIPDEPSAAVHFYSCSGGQEAKLQLRIETKSPTPILGIETGPADQNGLVIGALTGKDLYVMRKTQSE